MKDGALPPLPPMSSWLSVCLFRHRDYFTFRFTFHLETNKYLDFIEIFQSFILTLLRFVQITENGNMIGES
jgi:hypothetical protein